MRPGMKCLLELLRGPCLDPNATRETEWDAVLALAEDEHVLPWAVACLHAQPNSLPPGASGRIAVIDHQATIEAFFWSSELKSVLQAFEQSQLITVPLKGPCLAERLYGSARLRVSRDLDLLVSKTDLARAEAVLTALGFVPDAPDDYHRPWHRDTTTLELHHNVENPLAFDFHVEDALRRVMRADFQGQPCWVLAPEDELLFLCLHAARHRFERLSLTLDLKLAFEKLPKDVWHPRPEVAGLNHLLTLGFAVARRLQPDLNAPVKFAASPTELHRLEALADRLWSRLLTQPGEALDWRAAHAFYLQIESPGLPRMRSRFRHLQILAGRAIDLDYNFAARFGLHRTWQVRLLRPLRLLSDLIRH